MLIRGLRVIARFESWCLSQSWGQDVAFVDDSKNIRFLNFLVRFILQLELIWSQTTK